MQEQLTFTRLGDFVVVKGRIGWRGLKKKEYTQNGPYMVSGNNLLNRKIDWQNCFHISNFRYDESPEIKLQTNDIIMTKDGTIGRLAIIRDLPGPATINSTIALIRETAGVFLPEFLYYYFQGPAFQKIVKARVSGLAVPHIFQRDIKELKVPYFSKDEQRVVASILSRIDDLIEKLDDIIAHTEGLKKGLREKLILGAISQKPAFESEVSEIPRGWKVWRFGDIAQTYRYPTFYNIQYKPSGVPVLNIGNIENSTWKLLTDLNDYQKIDRETSQRFPKTIVEEDDLVLAVRGATIGKFALVPKILASSNINANLLRISLNKSICDPFYFWCYTQTSQGLSNFRKYISYTAKETVQAGKLKTWKITLPPLEDQRKIRSILQSQERLLENLYNYRSNTYRIKGGLMQRLFTGQVRVKF